MNSKNKMFARASLGLSVLAMVAAITACGGGGDDSSDGGSNSTGDPADVPLAQAPTLVQEYATAFNAARAVARKCGDKDMPAVAALTKYNPKMQAAIQAHVDDMLANNYYSHTGLDGSTPSDRLRKAGYTGVYGGEILAAGSSQSPQRTLELNVQSWLASPGHCEIIMWPGLTTLGVGTNDHYQGALFGIE